VFFNYLENSEMPCRRPILLVCEEDEIYWDLVLHEFPNGVHWIQGSCGSASDLLKLNLIQAWQFTIISSERPPTEVEGDFIESDSILAYLQIERFLPPNLFFTIELPSTDIGVLNATLLRRRKDSLDQLLSRSQKNFGQLSDSSSSMTVRGVFSTQRKSEMSFRGGMSMDEGDRNSKSLASMRKDEDDRLVSQINTKSRSVLKKVANITSFYDITHTYYATEAFSSAHVFCSGISETLLAQTFYEKLTPVCCEMLVRGRGGGIVHQLPVPSQFFGANYISLFRHLLFHQVVAISLYRSPNASRKSNLSYVYTTPIQTSTLSRGDLVFVLGSVEGIKNVEKYYNVQSGCKWETNYQL